MIRVIHAEIFSKDFTQLNQLVNDFCSAYRYSFCGFQKDKLEFNDVRNNTKAKFIDKLNTRQISDAVMLSQSLYIRAKDKPVIFGGRKKWYELIEGTISNKEWNALRNNQIYSRGDKTKSGNSNIRILNENELRITVGNRQFINCNLFVPKKYKTKLELLLNSGNSYNVRLIRKCDTLYDVIIDYQVENTQEVIGFNNGVIGIDTNPDRIAVCDLNNKGQYLDSFSIVNTRMYFGNTDKRNYEIGCIVRQVIKLALDKNKGIVFENLDFNKETFVDKGRRFNRKRKQFVWKKFLSLLERKCIEFGIQYKKVHPAYTSFIGKVKYQKMYNLNIHESAAYVIGRRGLGYNEKISIHKQNPIRVKQILLDLAGDSKVKFHSWKLWGLIKHNYKAVLTGLQTGISNLQELESNVCYVGVNPTG